MRRKSFPPDLDTLGGAVDGAAGIPAVRDPALLRTPGEEGTSTEAGLPASDGASSVGIAGIAAAGAGLSVGVGSIPIPLGVLPVAFLIAYLLYRAYNYLAERAEDAATVQPLTPMGLRKVVGPQPSLGFGTERRDALTGPTTRKLRVWRRDGVWESTEPWTPTSTSVSPPATSTFARNMMVTFGVFVLLVLLVRHPFFYVYDLIVKGVGEFIYWPHPWPGVIPAPTPTSVAPDYIFLMYFSMIFSFLVASGVPFSDRYPSGQRRLIFALVAFYLPTEILIDVAFFTINEPFTASAFFVIRGFVGGVYFAAVLIATLVLPSPLRLVRRFPRDRRALVTFFASALTAILIAGAILFALFRYAGLGRLVVPFAILLLLPLIALTVWGVIGRVLYEVEVGRRPPAPLSVYRPSVTVIIPAFNEESGIAQAIRSADGAAGRYGGVVELLIANDGSTDRTLEVARKEVGLLKHAHGAVIDLPHGGKSNALNGALRVALGEIIIRVDADSRISRSTGFSTIVGHLAQPEVGGVQGLILPLQEEGWTRKLRMMEIAWTHLFLRRPTMATRTTQVVDGAFCAFRRVDLLEVGGWVPWNGEDTEVTMRLQRVGFRMRFETGAAAYEDVPENYRQLERQRIRWNRGGLFAHQRHFSSLFSDTPEFGGIAMLYWLVLFIRSGMRSLIYVYAVLVVLYLPTLLHVAVIAGILLIPRAIVIGFFLIRYGRARYLPWIVVWPGTAAVKAHFAVESFGTMLPGAMPEFAE